MNMKDSNDIVEQRVPESQQATPYAYYALLIGLYQALFGVFILLYRFWRHPLERLSPLDLTLLGMATLRLSKAISEDEITTVLRQPVVKVVDGQRQPQGRGLRWALGKLVLCPTCTGTWIAAILTYALHLSPRYTRPFLAMMSASGFSQFTDALLSLVYTDRDVLRKESTK
jgi:hypothetical protein